MKVLCTVVIALAVLFDSIVCETDWSDVSIKKAKKSDIDNLLTGPFGHMKATLPLSLLTFHGIIFGYIDGNGVARALYTFNGVGERHDRAGQDIGANFISKTVPDYVKQASGSWCCDFFS
ncbi:uncharacterized protein LOC117178823 [Belonocnema kinseyi]|uniref:uncharacterized protein LOC117178823 n=1 Tax=Belonocnema kinseyi TaxID=2817044 RepID=UPI00143D233F|nr:uncharacterized protein LOC117178823 [Belonocnema kinseyi]